VIRISTSSYFGSRIWMREFADHYLERFNLFFLVSKRNILLTGAIVSVCEYYIFTLMFTRDLYSSPLQSQCSVSLFYFLLSLWPNRLLNSYRNQWEMNYFFRKSRYVWYKFLRQSRLFELPCSAASRWYTKSEYVDLDPFSSCTTHSTLKFIPKRLSQSFRMSVLSFVTFSLPSDSVSCYTKIARESIVQIRL